MNNFNIKILLTSIRALMVPLSVFALIFDYSVAAMVQGLLIHTLAPELGFWSYLIAAAIQLTRAILVFIPFMESDRPVMGFSSEIITGAMGALAIYEIIHLNGAGVIHSATTLSLCVLMVMCFGVEFYLLRCIKTRSQDDFFSSSSKMNGLQKKVVNKANYRIFSSQLKVAVANYLEESSKNLDSTGGLKQSDEKDVIKYQSIIPNGVGAKV